MLLAAATFFATTGSTLMAGGVEPTFLFKTETSKEWGEFIGVDSCGNFYFDCNGPVMVLSPSGSVLRTLPVLPNIFIREAVFMDTMGVRSIVLTKCGWVIHAPGVERPHWVSDPENKLIRLLEPWGFKFIQQIDGTFIGIAETEDIGRRKQSIPKLSRKAQDYLEFRYYLYDSEGNYIKEINKTPERRLSAQTYDGYLMSKKVAQQITKDSGKNECKCFGRSDGAGNFLICHAYNKGQRDYQLFVFKLPRIDTPPDAPQAEVVPLDGFGFPLPDRKGPPSIAADCGNAAGGCPILTFLYPEQDIRVDNGLYPVYSLWDYQLSQYQRDNPGAILGSIAAAGVNPMQIQGFEIAPWIELDFTKNAETGGCDMRLWQNRINYPMRGEGYHYVWDVDARKHGYMVPKIEFVKGMPKEQKIITRGPQRLTLNLDPSVPEVLWMDPTIPQPSMETKRLVVFIETGDDTKVFVPPYVMTRLWLKPKDWPSKERATILAHSRNWHDGGKEDTVRLTETEPGSGRFVSQDGKVTYELRHVMDVEKNKVASTTPEIINYIYLFITDPAIGLDRAPQLIFENGQDSEEYWSIAEPEWTLINYPFYRPWGYKPWSQVSEETANARFHVEVSGNTPANPALSISWDGPDGKRQSAVVPLKPEGDGKYKTTTPLFAFAPKGCDIGKTWWWKEDLPTPQIPGAITFRDKNVKWEVVGQ